MKKILLLSLLMVFSVMSFSQNSTVYGMSWNNGKAILVYAATDSGNVHKVDTVFTIGGLSTSISTAGFGGRYIIKTNDTAMTSRLFDIDMNTGIVNYSPELSEGISEPQYYCDNDSIYGLWWDGNMEYLASVNKITGQRTTICSIPGFKMLPTGQTTFDQLNGRYIVIGMDSLFNSRLYEIDVNTASVVTDIILANSVTEIQWSGVNDSLYGLYWDGSHARLASLNRVTGQRTDVCQILNTGGLSAGISAFDHTLGNFLFTANDSLFTTRLFEIDVVNGILLNSPVLSHYITEIVSPEIYCKTENIEQVNKEENILKLYPNPAYSILNVENINITDKRYYIYNIQGILMLSGDINLSDYRINVSCLAPGVYLIRSGELRSRFIKL